MPYQYKARSLVRESTVVALPQTVNASLQHVLYICKPHALLDPGS